MEARPDARAVHAARGLAESCAGLVERAARPVIDLTRPPVEMVARPPIVLIINQGRHVRTAMFAAINHAADVALPRLVEAVVSHLDVGKIVQDNVDLNQIAAGIDVDALIKRVDLVGVAEYVIEEVDMPELIRQSSAAATSETVRGVRVRGMEADQAITRAVDRFRPRRRGHAHGRADADPDGNQGESAP